MNKILSQSDFIINRTYEPVGLSETRVIGSLVCSPADTGQSRHDIVVACNYRYTSYDHGRDSDMLDFYFALVGEGQNEIPHIKFMSLIINYHPKPRFIRKVDRYRLIVDSFSCRCLSQDEHMFIVDSALKHYLVPDYGYILSITRPIDRLEYDIPGASPSTGMLKPFNVQISHSAGYSLKNKYQVMSSIRTLASQCPKCGKRNSCCSLGRAQDSSIRDCISIRVKHKTRSIRHAQKGILTDGYDFNFDVKYVPSSCTIYINARLHVNKPYLDTFDIERSQSGQFTNRLFKRVASWNDFFYELATLLNNLKPIH